MTKKQIAIALIITSIVGFVYSQNLKSKYLIFNKRLTSKDEFVTKIPVITDRNYIFSFWGSDEETGFQQWADLEITYKIQSAAGNLIHENRVTASASQEKGGIRRAVNGNDVKYKADITQDLLITCQLVDGNDFDIEIYENLPEKLYWYPVLFIGVFIFSIFFFMKARASENNV